MKICFLVILPSFDIILSIITESYYYNVVNKFPVLSWIYIKVWRIRKSWPNHKIWMELDRKSFPLTLWSIKYQVSNTWIRIIRKHKILHILGDCVVADIILIWISYHSKKNAFIYYLFKLVLLVCLLSTYTKLLWILTNLVSNLPFHIQLRLYHALLNAIYGCMFIYLYQKYLLLISLIVVFMYIRSSTHFIHIQSIISYQRVIMLIKPIKSSNFV